MSVSRDTFDSLSTELMTIRSPVLATPATMPDNTARLTVPNDDRKRNPTSFMTIKFDWAGGTQLTITERFSQPKAGSSNLDLDIIICVTGNSALL